MNLTLHQIDFELWWANYHKHHAHIKHIKSGYSDKAAHERFVYYFNRANDLLALKKKLT